MDDDRAMVATRGMVLWWIAVAMVGVWAGCSREEAHVDESFDDVQAISFLGDTLETPAFDSVTLTRLEANLETARAEFEANPLDADAAIWYGRRLAYLGRYRDAIAVYSAGLSAHPEDARFLRHRGHRNITTRRLDLAIDDFIAAAQLVAGQPDEIEPDGMPNERGIPTSTLQSNIWYHLGLAHYLRGDFERALSSYRECMKVSANPDMQVATANWLYMTLRRLGRDDDARGVLEPIHAEMDIIENQAYHDLLLMYKGELEAGSLLGSLDGADAIDNATVGYGVGNWFLYNGRAEEAREIFERILESSQWAAFGYIAAEAEMERMRAE
jgi:tetratricopeptide (TPR) repeat protein